MSIFQNNTQTTYFFAIMFIMRNISFPALILQVKQSGENNRTVTVFSAEEGISYATLYGGPKSKLRSLVSPMNSGMIYIYRDESKKQSKIIDFDVKNYHLSFRENLFKTWASSLMAEILLKTQCAGSPEQSWTIANGFIDGMELSSEEESRIGLVRFIWRYLELLGVKPETKSCLQCGESFHALKFNNVALSCKYVLDSQGNGFICPDCFMPEESTSKAAGFRFKLGKASITYLEAVTSLSPKEVRALKVSREEFMEMKNIVYHLLENACGSKLRSLESGIGIL